MVTKLTLEYDGSAFAGWGRQPGLRTVQEVLERALQTVLGETGADGRPLRLAVAGRTDSGVHAWAQVASYAHEAVDPLRLNGLLDDDIAVLAAEPMQDGFDARRDARSRTYCYRVLARRARSVFARRTSFWWTGELELAALEACASRCSAARTSRRSRRVRPSTRGFTATSRAPNGARTATCSSSGSRPTCSCAT